MIDHGNRSGSKPEDDPLVQVGSGVRSVLWVTNDRCPPIVGNLMQHTGDVLGRWRTSPPAGPTPGWITVALYPAGGWVIVSAAPADGPRLPLMSRRER